MSEHVLDISDASRGSDCIPYGTGFLTKEGRAREDLRGSCLGAIETMRRFLDDAERQIKDDRSRTDFNEPQVWPGLVVHALGWGAANASTALERGIRRLRLPVEKETP